MDNSTNAASREALVSAALELAHQRFETATTDLEADRAKRRIEELSYQLSIEIAKARLSKPIDVVKNEILG